MRAKSGFSFVRVSLLVSLALSLNISVAQAASRPVKWPKSSVSVSVVQGRVSNVVLKVRSTSKLKNGRFTMSSGLAGVMKVTPASVKTWKKNAKKTVTLRFAPAVSVRPGMHSGTLTAKTGSKRVSSALAIRVNVVARVVPLPPPVSFTPGSEHILVTKNIGTGGGTIEAPAGSRMVGVSVTFPAGALQGDVSVQLGYNDGSFGGQALQGAGYALVLKTGSSTRFSQPITITVPIGARGKTPVPYFIDSSGALRPAQLIGINPLAGTFTFQTFHSSWYTWIYTSVADLLGVGDRNTGYDPNRDGFQIVNTGSEYNRNGECFGMTSFSLWYFMHAKSHGDFYPRFMTQLGSTAGGQPIKGQNVIATRAFTSIARQWDVYYDPIATQQLAVSAEARYLNIANAILSTGRPVLIYLSHNHPLGEGQGQHSVLAYGFNDLSNRLFIYDPNKPGTSQSIYYNKDTKQFVAYDSAGYEDITFNGDGSLNLAEDYQNILADAEANFHGTASAHITVDSPTSGGNTASRTERFTGTIESGQVLVSKLVVYAGSTPFTVAVDTDGKFDVPVNLEAGVNHIVFKTVGLNASGHEVLVPNDMDRTDFSVDLESAVSMMLVTLTWDTDASDVDLYVTDPLGATSWWVERTTPSGGTLDYDQRQGYGPEHWTLLPTNTIQFGQPYHVQVHYYTDHDAGPTNYTVTIKCYEGTGRVTEQTYTGWLGTWDSGNDSPGSTGADWDDVADVVLTH